SHRQIVTAAIVATIPRLTASIASSALDQRESGTPRSAGSSHAIALTSATCAGGKTPRPTRPRSLLKTLDSLLAEPYSPGRHRRARASQPLSDLRVCQSLTSQRHRLRPHHIPIRPGVRRRAPLELTPLRLAQHHRMRGLLRHAPRFATGVMTPSRKYARYLRGRPLSRAS